VLEQAVIGSGGAILGATLLAAIACAIVALFVINILKGKPGMAVAGILIHFTWYIGAIRLAKPNSWWARHYYVGKNEDKVERAIARHRPGPNTFAGSDIVREGWLAGTVPRDQGVPVQRRNPETGEWVMVYVPEADTSTGPSRDSPIGAEAEPVRASAPTPHAIVNQDKRRFCERCGHRLGSMARFCGACGNPVTAAGDAP
jgi:hypothetical protein